MPTETPIYYVIMELERGPMSMHFTMYHILKVIETTVEQALQQDFYATHVAPYYDVSQPPRTIQTFVIRREPDNPFRDF